MGVREPVRADTVLQRAREGAATVFTDTLRFKRLCTESDRGLTIHANRCTPRDQGVTIRKP